MELIKVSIDGEMFDYNDDYVSESIHKNMLFILEYLTDDKRKLININDYSINPTDPLSNLMVFKSTTYGCEVEMPISIMQYNVEEEKTEKIAINFDLYHNIIDDSLNILFYFYGDEYSVKKQKLDNKQIIDYEIRFLNNYKPELSLIDKLISMDKIRYNGKDKKSNYDLDVDFSYESNKDCSYTKFIVTKHKKEIKNIDYKKIFHFNLENINRVNKYIIMSRNLNLCSYENILNSIGIEIDDYLRIESEEEQFSLIIKSISCCKYCDALSIMDRLGFSLKRN